MRLIETVERVDELEAHLIEGRRGRMLALLHLPRPGRESVPRPQTASTTGSGSSASVGERCPVIICCHGFSGEHISPNRLGVEFARAAVRAGMAVLRFDFVGSGDSDGDFATETSLGGWMEDLRDMVRFARSHSRIDPDRVATLGLSLGGATVLGVGTVGGAVRAVGCWAPVVHPVETFQERVLGPGLWARLVAGETVANFYGKAYSLAPQFASDLEKHDIVAAASRIPPAPIWIAHGTGDPVIPLAHSQELKEKLGGAVELEIFPGADHVFSQCRAPLIEATVRWFRSKLVD